MRIERNHLKGIGYMLMAMLVYSLVNASVKSVMAHYPVIEVLFFRYGCALIPYGLLLIKSRNFNVLKTQQLSWHVASAALSLVTLGSLFESLKLLPLAEATAITFASVLFLTLLAILFLKEYPSPRLWLAILIGFGGVLIMLNPTAEVLNVGGLLCLFAAFGDAVVMLLARHLTKRDQSLTVVFYFAGCATLMATLLLPFAWVTPSQDDLVLLVFLGVGGGIAQYCMTEAYRHAPAPVVAPFIYTSLIWAASFGYGLWGELPNWRTVMGAILVTLSGLVVVTTRARQAS